MPAVGSREGKREGVDALGPGVIPGEMGVTGEGPPTSGLRSSSDGGVSRAKSWLVVMMSRGKIMEGEDAGPTTRAGAIVLSRPCWTWAAPGIGAL